MHSNEIIAALIAGMVVILAIGGYFAYEVYRSTRPNILKVWITSKDKRQRAKIAKIVSGKVTIGGHTYNVETDRVYYTGMYRIPTAHYVEGAFEPYDILEGAVSSKISSEDYHDAVESHVANDILKAFDKPTISTTTSLVILLIVMVGGLGWIIYDHGQKLSDIATMIGGS
jgi:hypothetical protein